MSFVLSKTYSIVLQSLGLNNLKECFFMTLLLKENNDPPIFQGLSFSSKDQLLDFDLSNFLFSPLILMLLVENMSSFSSYLN